MTTPEEIIRLEQVGLKAGFGNALLSDISFKSGSGKTSLLRLLNRLNEPTQGEIFFNHQSIRQIPITSLRQQITLVHQESKLLGMTVRQALAYPLQLRSVPPTTIQQRISTCTEQLHIPPDWLDRSEVQLSLGQRQWIAIARALIIQPPVLLLDEPTSSLDFGRADFLIKQLIDISETQQTTTFMVNQQLHLAQQFCDRVLHLQQGKLIQDLPCDQANWSEIQQNLLQVEIQATQEWE
jgi:D-methionine transport system ATP-binding protein